MEKNTLQNSLNELSKGTTNDVDSIMIRDAAGNQYWIAKADLASVLGGLIETASYNKRGLAPQYGGPMFLNIEANKEVVFNIGYCLVTIGISYSGHIGVYTIGSMIGEIQSVSGIAVVNRGGSTVDGKLNIVQTDEYSFKIVNKDNVMRSASIGIVRTR